MLSQDGHPSGPAAGDDDGPLAVTARLLLLIAPVGLLGLVVLAAGVVEPAVRAGGVAPPGRPAGRGARASARRAGAALGRRARGPGGPPGGRWSPPAPPGWCCCRSRCCAALGEGAGELGTLLLRHARRAGVVGPGRRARGRGSSPALALRRAGGRPSGAGGGRSPSACRRRPRWSRISWAGHASSGGDRTANIVIDALHNGATAAWLGGLLGLAVLALPGRPGARRRPTGCGSAPAWWCGSPRSR